MRFKLRRPKVPTVLSLLALFIVLGGSATAGVMITKSSQLGKNVVTGAKIKKGSISSSKLSKSARSHLRGVGLKGLAGDKGPQGDSGVDGQAGAKGETGDKGRQGNPGSDGKDGKQGLPGDIGPSSISLVGRIEIINAGLPPCRWKTPNGYMVPEGAIPPTLTWVWNGRCILEFSSGSRVKWATVNGTSDITNVSVDPDSGVVTVSMLDVYHEPSEGSAFIVVYRDPR